MTPMLNRKLKYYLRMQYPVRIVAGTEGLVGSHPDLPGCTVIADSAPAVYAALELARRDWISEHVAAGDEIPAPNAHLSPVSDENDSSSGLRPQIYAQREATPF